VIKLLVKIFFSSFSFCLSSSFFLLQKFLLLSIFLISSFISSIFFSKLEFNSAKIFCELKNIQKKIIVIKKIFLADRKIFLFIVKIFAKKNKKTKFFYLVFL
jgi:hypothetical protein